jgi:hypothetical protein
MRTPCFNAPRRALVLVLVLLVAGLTACTPEVEAWWNALTPEGRSAVLAEIQSQASDCHGQVDRQWPASSRAWAHRIVNRESRGIATAQNSRSSAAGCFQLLRVHAWRFDRCGFTWADRYRARANVCAALDLYREQGARPW